MERHEGGRGAVSVRRIYHFEATCDGCGMTERYEGELWAIPDGWTGLKTVSHNGRAVLGERHYCPSCKDTVQVPELVDTDEASV